MTGFGQGAKSCEGSDPVNMLRTAIPLLASLMLAGACSWVQYPLDPIEVSAAAPMLDGGGEVVSLAWSDTTATRSALGIRPSPSVGVIMEPLWAGRFHGRLVDGFRQALPDVPLRIVHTAEEFRIDARPVDPGAAWIAAEDGRRYAAVRSDGQGRFAASGLAPGEYTVYAEAEDAGHWKALNDVSLKPREAPHELRLETSRLVIQIRLPDGSLTNFNPNATSATRANDGEWGLEPDTLYVRLAPVLGYEPPRPGYSWIRDEPAETVRWFATKDASRWQVHIPTDQPYRLLVAADDRAPVGRRVVLRAGQRQRTIEMAAGPRVKPGRLSLAIHDPRGTWGVGGYGVTVMPEEGPALGAFTRRFHMSLSSNDDVVPRVHLRLPPGTYDLGIRPIHEAEGALCGNGHSDQVEPGSASIRVGISAGGEHEAIVRTPPQAEVIAHGPPGWPAWTFRVVALGSMAVLAEQEVRYNSPHGRAKVPAGTVRVEAHLAGRALRPWTGVLKHGQRLILHQDEDGFL